MKQVWFTMNNRPLETQADKDEYNRLTENISPPLGFGWDDRHLYRCQCEDFTPLYEFLVAKNKMPFIVGAKNQDGSWVLDAEGNELYPHVDDEYFVHMKAEDTEGNEILTSDNTSAGWACYLEFPEVIE